MSLAWSSSTTTAPGRGQHRRQRLGPRRGQGGAGRVLRPGLQDDGPHRLAGDRRRQLLDDGPVVVDVDAGRPRSRAARAGRAAAGTTGARPRRDRRGGARRWRPGRARPSPRRRRSAPRAGTATTPRAPPRASGQHGVVEVARRQRLLAHPGDRRAQVGQQRGVGRAGRQVEGEVAGPLGDPAVAPGAAGAGRRAHERAAARRAARWRPTAARLRHASLTVVGETPSRRDSSRTVGSRAPTGRSPAVIMRPMTAAMRRALRPSPSASALAVTAHDDVVEHAVSSVRRVVGRL